MRLKIFLKLPKCLGDLYFEMITYIEGCQLSNNIYDSTIKTGLKEEGFRIFPGDEQTITKSTTDGHFILAAQVVDNFIITSTCPDLVTQLYHAVENMGYILNTEADDKFIGPYGDIHVNQESKAYQKENGKV